MASMLSMEERLNIDDSDGETVKTRRTGFINETTSYPRVGHGMVHLFKTHGRAESGTRLV